MNILEAILLGLIQGITEYFPVSSSGHLLLLPGILESLGLSLDFSFQNNSYDIILHIGTFLALVLVFRQRIWDLLTKRTPENTKLLKNLALTTIPMIFIGGIVFVTGIEERQSEMVGVITLVVIGIAFVVIDLFPGTLRKLINPADKAATIESMSAALAIKIGIWQLLSLVKGVSRSGITLLAGILSGMSRKEALDYSFLASIPLFAILTTVEILYLVIRPEANSYGFGEVLAGVVAAFIAALLAITFFRGFIEKKFVLAGFGVYRIALAIITLVLMQS
jgi:undecaprenyl-diphosphatase